MENAHVLELATVGAPGAALGAEGRQDMSEVATRISMVTRVAEGLAALGIVGHAAVGMDVYGGCTSGGL